MPKVTQLGSDRDRREPRFNSLPNVCPCYYFIRLLAWWGWGNRDLRRFFWNLEVLEDDQTKKPWRIKVGGWCQGSRNATITFIPNVCNI